MAIVENNIKDEWGLSIHTDNTNDLLSYDPDILRKKIYQHKFLLIRGSTGSIEDFWKICSKLGNPMETQGYSLMKEYHESIVIDGHIRYYGKISNILSPKLGTGVMPWHADNPDIGNNSYPLRCLRMVKCPNPKAGFTGFLNIALAWKRLDLETKLKWRTYRIEQQSWYRPGMDIKVVDSVKIHPITGEESPTLNHHNKNGRKDAWVKDILDVTGSRLTCEPMSDIISTMELMTDCVYHHVWQEGDIVMYDNHPLLHNRTNLAISNTEERLMWRINVLHDPSRPLMQHTSVPYHHSI